MNIPEIVDFLQDNPFEDIYDKILLDLGITVYHEDFTDEELYDLIKKKGKLQEVIMFLRDLIKYIDDHSPKINRPDKLICDIQEYLWTLQWEDVKE